MPQNQAVVIQNPNSRTVVVQDAPYHPPSPNEIVITNRAVAINPVDWKMLDLGVLIESYPCSMGCDVAGVVQAVGRSVQRFKEGDRVIGQSPCLSLGPKYAAFQSFVPCPENVACHIPTNLSFTQACVLPLVVNTAGLALFSRDNLGLPYPSLEPSSTDKAVFIYGGSTGVGSAAIQLAKSAGAHVITATSERNREYCTALGADQVFDYRDAEWIKKAADALKYKSLYGIFDTVSEESTFGSIAKLSSFLDDKPVLVTTFPAPTEMNAKMAFGTDMVYDDEVAKAIWLNFLPQALEQGKFAPKPDAIVAGTSLDAVGTGMDMQRKGVSAKKVVVQMV